MCALLKIHKWWTISFSSISKERLKQCPREDDYRTYARYNARLKSLPAFSAGVQSSLGTLYSQKALTSFTLFCLYARAKVISFVILPGNGVGTLRSGLFLYYGVEARMQPQTFYRMHMHTWWDSFLGKFDRVASRGMQD